MPGGPPVVDLRNMDRRWDHQLRGDPAIDPTNGSIFGTPGHRAPTAWLNASNLLHSEGLALRQLCRASGRLIRNKSGAAAGAWVNELPPGTRKVFSLGDFHRPAHFESVRWWSPPYQLRKAAPSD